MRFSKELRKLIKELEMQGFRVEDKGTKIMIFPPDPSQPIVGTHKTPSDHRAWKNFMADLRRVGFKDRRK